jgi:hypothetical protein
MLTTAGLVAVGILAAAMFSGCKGRSKNRYPMPQVQSIDISPLNRAVPNDQLLQYTATITFNNGMLVDGTRIVEWNSSDTSVATISNAAGFEGLLTAIGVGNSTISATYEITTTSTFVFVSSAILTGIQVAPSSTNIPIGRNQQLAAIGTFSDSSTFDVTLAVSWLSDNSAIAEVSDTYPTKGLITGRSIGGTLVHATQGLISNASTIIVSEKILDLILLDPWSPTAMVGDTVEFSATGVYSDLSTQDLTTSVTWYSSIPAVASVSNTPPLNGEAACYSTGTTMIQAVQGSVSNSTGLSVSLVNFVENASAVHLDDIRPGMDLTVFDYDGNGSPDIYVSNYIENNIIYANDGYGIFSDKAIIAQVFGGLLPTGQSPTTGASWADWDVDGDIDLFLTNGSPEQGFSWPNILYRNSGNAIFNGVTVSPLVNTDFPSQAAAWGDYDNDGDMDCYVVNGTAASINPDLLENQLFNNDGTGIFTDGTTAAGVSNKQAGFATAFIDVNEDGLPDIYVANIGTTNRLFLNQGLGLFQDYSTQSGAADGDDSVAFAIGDYNNDGRPDIYVVNAGGFPDNHLYRNNGGGQFTEVSGPAGAADNGDGRCAAWGDFDADGYLDLYVVNYSSDGTAMNRLFHNNGDGTFTDFAHLLGVAGNGYSTSAVWGDFNADGDLDLYVANNAAGRGSGVNGRNHYYENQGTGKYWIAINLVPGATNKNKFAVGAKVTVSAGAIVMTRWVIATDSHGGACSMPLFFGLDDNTQCYVAVTWPGGKIQNVPGAQDAGQVLEIQEQ